MEESPPESAAPPAPPPQEAKGTLAKRLLGRPRTFRWKCKTLDIARKSVATRGLHPRFARVRSRALLEKLSQRVRARMKSRRFWALSMLLHLALLTVFSLLALDSLSRKTDVHPVLTVTDAGLPAAFVPPPPPAPEKSETPPELLNAEVADEESPLLSETETERELPAPPLAEGDAAPPAPSSERLLETIRIDIGNVGDPEWTAFKPRRSTQGHAVAAEGVISGPGSGGSAGPAHGTAPSGAPDRGTGTSAGPAPGSGDGGVWRGAAATHMDGGAYPRKAQKEAREGVVQLRVEVLETGRVGAIELFRSSGHADLDETALEAARRWRFRPATRDGVPMATWVIVPVRYLLAEQR